VSNGGGNFRGQLGVQNYTAAGPAFTVNMGFNVSGANNALSTNGTVTIAGLTTLTNTDADDALNVSNGGGNFRGQLSVQNYTSATIPAFTINSGFNISGADGSLRTNSTVTILNTDDDDGLNLTGGIFIGTGNSGAQFGIGSLTISDIGVITTDAGIGPAAGRGNIIIRSLTAQALSINSGFNVSGPTLAMRTNGTVTILNTDPDDALNVTGGVVIGVGGGPGTQLKVSSLIISDLNVITTQPTIAANGNVVINSLAAQALSINSGFNVSGQTLGLQTNGTITIINSDADDALNVTGSMASQGAAITIGNAESTTQHRLVVFDGGVNKCAYIRLFDDTGADWFLFANSTGQLRMFATEPTGAGECNTGGGSVGGQVP
ncbi:MAG: hypothetical protein AABX82_02535, partial [Nanoarchaeota archaeon]